MHRILDHQNMFKFEEEISNCQYFLFRCSCPGVRVNAIFNGRRGDILRGGPLPEGVGQQDPSAGRGRGEVLRQSHDGSHFFNW